MPISPLVNAKNAYPAMLSAIAQAKHSIYFANYWTRPGEQWDTFITTLTAAARRGVTVYLLLDAQGSRPIAQEPLDVFQEAGGRFVWFRPFEARHPLRFNKRNHKKLLIIDDRLGFTGGMGIGDQWMRPSAQFPLARRDTHFKVTGPIISELTASFTRSWNQFVPSDQQLVAPGQEQDIEALFITLINNATAHINLTTAYFAPSRALRAVLIAAAQRGVAVRVLTNGRYTTHWYAQTAGAQLYNRLLRRGIHIYEYAPTIIHTKMLTADQRMGLIGSANFNFRSTRHDQEFDLEITDRDLIKQLDQQFEADLGASDEVTLETQRQRSLGKRLIQAITSCARYFF